MICQNNDEINNMDLFFITVDIFVFITVNMDLIF